MIQGSHSWVFIKKKKKKGRKKTLILKYTCSLVFIADLFTKAKTETVSVHQLAIKKPWYTHRTMTQP